jgi:myo-inositol-1(or 4)-monophosphatase
MRSGLLFFHATVSIGNMEFSSFIINLAKASAAELMERRQAAFTVSHKNDNPKDVVTSLDIEMGEFITERIRSAFPEHGIHNEEASDISGNEYTWVIDPIDGSAAFARDIPQFSIAIGVLKDGVPEAGAVIDPSTGELFSFERGKGVRLNGEPVGVSARDQLSDAFVLFAAGRKSEQREWAGQSYATLLGTVNKTKNFGSSALSLAYIASGRIEAVVAGTFTTLDIAAAIGLLEEAGGCVLDERGQPAALRTGAQKVFAARSPEMARELFELLG